jgi:Bacterial SH3 domain
VAGDRDPIANTGLTERLEQHSQKNGYALGIAMAGCILIALAGFIFLYTHISILPDFSNKIDTTSIPSSRQPVSGTPVSGGQGITPPATIRPGTPNANATTQASVPSPTPANAAPTQPPAATPGTGTPSTVATPTTAFKPNYRIAGGFTINFRSGPSKNDPVVKTLPPGTELQFLNQTQEVEGEVWRRLRDAVGTEGWVRDIDLEKIPA